MDGQLQLIASLVGFLKKRYGVRQIARNIRFVSKTKNEYKSLSNMIYCVVMN
jgi:alanine-alpha-ketoisovalerate/valine-pyruvate aminotransferase